MRTRLLVIGYGNTLRSDDGVGPRAADTLAELRLPGVEAITAALLAPELADPISRAETVVFVDATVAPGTAAAVQIQPLEPAASSQIMAHAADPRTMLALARDVFGHAPQGYILTIPVEDMAIGEKLSDRAARGLEEAVALLRKMAALPPR
jgi:hydrogenase maturation protease